jgi:alkanesulfonate monooxygenase SsuD/methylene tetrahydromethanopterin reductase-like flavin-dependent oxidoreductase (luciferase family)
MVGGNGPNVTWRLAARYADELNLDGMAPDEVRQALPVIRRRCEEIGRDPDSLRVSVHYWWGDAASPGEPRVRSLSAYRELGLSRAIALLRETADSDETLERFAEDARAAGCDLADGASVSALRDRGRGR